MQVPLHSCWPETLHPHEPLLQEAPVPQAVQLVPQWAGSLFELQALSEHIMLPDGHDDEHDPLLQTWPLLHFMPQLPQLSAFDATHDPLQERYPFEQEHDPLLQVWPLPQLLPQAPQFRLSVCTLVHDPPHSVWLELQLVLAGLAQLATKSAEPRAAARTKREAFRASIFDSLWGIGSYTKPTVPAGAGLVSASRVGPPRRAAPTAEMRSPSYTCPPKTPTCFPSPGPAAKRPQPLSVRDVAGRATGVTPPRQQRRPTAVLGAAQVTGIITSE